MDSHHRQFAFLSIWLLRDRNEDVPATSLCLDCGRQFCEPCSRRHVSVPAFKHHKVITVATGSDVTTNKCGRHDNELLTYYCLTCYQFVCSLCITDTHHTCNVKVITEVGVLHIAMMEFTDREISLCVTHSI